MTTPTVISSGRIIAGDPSGEHRIIAGQRPALYERSDILRASLGILGDALDTLRARLEPVLLSSAPTPSSGDTVETSRGDDDSWLAGFLTDATSHVTELTNIVGDLTRRVDL